MVEILNPLPGGALRVGMKRALRHVKSGIAEWRGEDAIRFKDSHHRRKAARENNERHTCGGYDRSAHSGTLTQREAKAIPFAGNIARMGLSA